MRIHVELFVTAMVVVTVPSIEAFVAAPIQLPASVFPAAAAAACTRKTTTSSSTTSTSLDAASYLDNLGNPASTTTTTGGEQGRYSKAEQPASIQGGPRPESENHGNPYLQHLPPPLMHYAGQAGGGGGGPLDWDDDAIPTLIQGNSLRTWAIPNDETSRVKVSLRSEGRPISSEVELWVGPDYTPMKVKVYSEDGNLRPFNCIVETPHASNTIAVYNTADMEFPFFANLEEYQPGHTHGIATSASELIETTIPRIIQGGSIASYPFPPEVASVQLLLTTDGRNLKARIELMHGPNNDKQVMEFYSSDGYQRPFYCIIETPGSGNVVRMINENSMEFPFFCTIAPFLIQELGPDGNGSNDFIID